ncbi:hypothetical protein ACFUTX_11115 [Microbacterium sp. NPDC057407]|uniref:hypothetical protein n=1 Tax=Microbacterium sp. NPDC057407 TaxID=3346120 RepID=UPI00366F79D8
MTDRPSRALWIMRILSALFLLAAGGIHLYLVFNGVGGMLGVLFTLNFVAGLVLAVAVVALRGRLLQIATVLGLLFLVATLGALLLALTVGLFGIRSTWDFTLVPETVAIETVGVVVLAVTTAMVLRMPRSA